MANLSGAPGQLGFIDFSVIGSAVNSLLPTAIDAYGKKVAAKVIAKAKPKATPKPTTGASVNVNTLQPTNAAPSVAFDFKPLLKPALIGTALLTTVLVLPRLIPRAS